MARNIMSMEAALDEERISVLALLESGTQNSRGTRGSNSSTGSGGGGRTSSPLPTPRSPVRSMLDIAEEPTQRHASIAATNGGITNATRSPVRSMLDIGPAPPIRSMLDIGPTTKKTHSAQTSPVESSHKHRTSLNNAVHARSVSDASSRPASFGPRSLPERNTKNDLTSEYQFSGILTNNSGGLMAPKRNTLAGKKPGTGVMSDIVRGSDLGALDRGRHQSIAGTGIGIAAGGKSMSPHNRLGLRSNSPHSNLLSPNPQNNVNSSSKFALDDGTLIDMNNAFRRLSDANLALSRGSLATLSNKAQQRRRTDSGDAAAVENTRLHKDYSYEEDDAIVDSSEDEHFHSSDEEGHRGRKKSGRANEGNEDDPERQTIGMGRAKGPRQALSLMAAAEEERQQIAQQEQKKYKVRSLLDPEIMVTGPGGERLKNSKPGIHPTTAFDQGGASGMTTPLDSDTEADITDIKRAQKLSVMMTSITSTPETSRCVRTIYRGDFAEMQKEASENHRRVRKYLVATDLSDEAAHALEWTVGTVLRDGDTLLAIYCVDEETGIPRPEGESAPTSEATNMTIQAATIAATTNKGLHSNLTTPTNHGPSPLGGTHSAAASPMGRARSLAEQERFKAVQDITDRVAKLLRKTRLQVRVVVEVIHCKSPKHLICEVIDFISPTLVILGSRGRSALKGSVPQPILNVYKAVKAFSSAKEFIEETALEKPLHLTTKELINQSAPAKPPSLNMSISELLEKSSNISPHKEFIKANLDPDRVILGSFSNYLVTKSSVPVMVARKRLRKHSKYKRPSVRLANNLTAGGKGLMSARVDEL